MPRYALLFFLILTPTLRAQKFLAYGTIAATHLSNVATSTTYTASGNTSRQSGGWAEEIGFGLTIPLGNPGPISIGLDLRGSPRGSSGIASALAGIKVAFHPRAIRVKPYAQYSFGYFSLARPQTSIYANNVSQAPAGTSTYTVYEGDFGNELIGGVDYPLTRHLELRPVEAGIGHSTEFDLLGGSGVSHVVFTLNSGLVLRF